MLFCIFKGQDKSIKKLMLSGKKDTAKLNHLGGISSGKAPILFYVFLFYRTTMIFNLK